MNRRLMVVIVTGIAAMITSTMFALADRPVGIGVTKVYSGPLPENMKSVTITSEQLTSLPILLNTISDAEANRVNGAREPSGFEGQITSSEANQLMQVLPFTEMTHPDEPFRSYYAVVEVGDKMYTVALTLFWMI